MLDPSDTIRCNACFAAVLPYEHIILGETMNDSHPPPIPAHIADEALRKEREVRETVRKLAQLIRCPHCVK